jgi:hypothetical protein
VEPSWLRAPVGAVQESATRRPEQMTCVKACDLDWLGVGLALPAKALKVGQEDYWLDQIAP